MHIMSSVDKTKQYHYIYTKKQIKQFKGLSQSIDRTSTK